MELNWRRYAACRDEDPELFFPVGDSGPALGQITAAKTVCWSRCQVRPECLTWALNHRQMDGVWGGASEQERRDMLHRPSTPTQGSGYQTEVCASRHRDRSDQCWPCPTRRVTTTGEVSA